MEGIRYRNGMVRPVAVNREGITIRALWRGTKLLPWELIRDVYAWQSPEGPYWSIRVVLVDGRVEVLPAPAPSSYVRPGYPQRAVDEIHRIRREAKAARPTGPQDAVPWEYQAAAVRELDFRGGIRRNGVLLLMIALFGLLGVLIMCVSARSEFGTSILADVPGPCTAAAAATDSAPHAWCAVTDGYVRDVLPGQGSELVLYLGPAPTWGKASEDDSVQAVFSTPPSVLTSLQVGDRVDYIAESGVGVGSITTRGVTVATYPGTTEGTAAGQRIAEFSGLFGAVCWPLFFGLWAACQRWPRRLRHARWALPPLAAAWFAGVSGFLADTVSGPALSPAGIVRLGITAACVATAGYAAFVAFRAWQARRTPKPSVLGGVA